MTNYSFFIPFVVIHRVRNENVSYRDDLVPYAFKLKLGHVLSDRPFRPHHRHSAFIKGEIPSDNFIQTILRKVEYRTLFQELFHRVDRDLLYPYDIL